MPRARLVAPTGLLSALVTTTLGRLGNAVRHSRALRTKL